MKLLITGGAGFIGSNFAHLICQERPDWEITILDALTYTSNLKSLETIRHKIRFVEGSVTDQTLVDELVAACNSVVHFAAEVHVDKSLQSPGVFVDTNIVGMYTVLEAVRRHQKRLHHVSTDEVFGSLTSQDTVKFTEDTKYAPSNPYSATKASQDMLVRAYVRSFGVQATLSNCTNNYGPYSHVEKYIPHTITNILHGGQPIVFGEGASVRDWIHVEDHCRAVLAILERGRLGETYMVSAGVESSVLQTAQLLLELMGRSPEDYKRVPDRPNDDVRYAADASKLKRELGWEPKFSDFRAGLANTIEWYQQHRDWWEHTKEKDNERLRNIILERTEATAPTIDPPAGAPTVQA
ncbi:MAG TPA: dTDP-glucose 4,6-dehydratase [Candidatus Saccharimonadales bacterium]|nr:dTDP-glucose 4,6-dehydratase [Candidatus Saccharimonadales bacterium]